MAAGVSANNVEWVDPLALGAQIPVPPSHFTPQNYFFDLIASDLLDGDASAYYDLSGDDPVCPTDWTNPFPASVPVPWLS